MPKDLKDVEATTFANLEKATGKSFRDWVAIVRKSGIDKHLELVKHLKAEYGIGHAQANLIVIRAKEELHGTGAKAADDGCGCFTNESMDEFAFCHAPKRCR